MDDTSTHGDDDLEDTEGESQDTETDEVGDTPADTDEESDEPKPNAEEVKAKQKEAWLKKIKSGEKTLDDMPRNLSWLRKDIEPELKKDGIKKEVDEDELDKRVKQALKKERDTEDLELLIDDLEENASPEELAQFKEEYESLRAEGLSALRATITARRLIGLEDNKTAIAERRKKGRLLPPMGGKRRDTVNKEKMTEIEKRLGGNLPPGFKA